MSWLERRSMKTLPRSFYCRPVVEVARALIGCILEHDGAAGVIVETEAYHESEPACHAFVGLTARTKTLFGKAGCAYVYRSYGIHALFNVVCEPVGVGAAVLVRALEPVAGLDEMRSRREAGIGRVLRVEDLCSGPGKLTEALGISMSDNGLDLQTSRIHLLERTGSWCNPVILEGPRVGITRAVDLPWRFCVAGNRHVSRPRPTETARQL